jgi:hypothetical protein
MQIFDHTIGFWEKRQFFRRKLAKIAENCDHNIDPCGLRIVKTYFYIVIFETLKQWVETKFVETIAEFFSQNFHQDSQQVCWLSRH